MTSHKAGISVFFNITFEREVEKMKKLLLHGVFVFSHPPRSAPRRTGLNYDVVLSLWYSDQVTLSSDIGWGKKERENERNENEIYYLLW